MRTSFYFKNPKSKKSERLYLSITWSPDKGKYNRYQTATKFEIEPRMFDTKRDRAKNQYVGSDLINRQLEQLESEIREAFNRIERKYITVTKELLKPEIDAILSGRKPATDFFSSLNEFYRFHLNKGSSGAVVGRIMALHDLLKAYQATIGKSISFEHFTAANFEEFKLFIGKQPNPKAKYADVYADSTIDSILRTLKSFLHWSLSKGYHSFTAFIDTKFKTVKAGSHITLNDDDIAAIQALDLPNNSLLDKARDLMIFQLSTAQRVTDVLKFNPENVRNGLWRFVIGKNKRVHSIALRDDALQVLAKYNGTLPKMNRVEYNRKLKELARMAGINELVTLVKYVKGNPVEVTKPKYEFLSSHTLRRTTITQLSQLGISDSQIAKLSGHQSMSALARYNQSSATEIKELIEAVKGKKP
jgi:integrase